MVPEKNDINIYVDKARASRPGLFSLQMLLQRLDNIHDKDTFLFCQFMQCLAQFICVFTRIFNGIRTRLFMIAAGIPLSAYQIIQGNVKGIGNQDGIAKKS